MILRLSDSLSRGLVVVAALLLGLWLSFFGIRAAIARYGAEGATANRAGGPASAFKSSVGAPGSVFRTWVLGFLSSIPHDLLTCPPQSAGKCI